MILILCGAAITVNAQSRKSIDLTYSLSSETIYWPDAEGFVLKRDSCRIIEKGDLYAANSNAAGEHGGTHFDARLRFAQGMPSIDRIPPYGTKRNS